MPLNYEPGDFEHNKYRDETFTIRHILPSLSAGNTRDTHLFDDASTPAHQVEASQPRLQPGEVWFIEVVHDFDVRPDSGSHGEFRDPDQPRTLRRWSHEFDTTFHQGNLLITYDETDNGRLHYRTDIDSAESDSHDVLISFQGIRLRRPSDTSNQYDDGNIESFD